MRTAVIDIGSNSIRLFVGEAVNNNFRILYRDLKTTRLGQGVSKNGALDDISIEKSLAVIQSFSQQAQAMGCNRIGAFATSAVREAGNGWQFVERVKRDTGIDVKILSGQEEAKFSFEGAKAGLKIAGPALVIDIGGGSTELTVGSSDIIKSISLPMGAVRFTQNILRSDPPASEEVRRAVTCAMELLSDFATSYMELFKNEKIVAIGVGGTFTTLAAMEQELESYDSDKVHGFMLEMSAVDRIFNKLLSLTIEQKRELPGLQPERADIITAGTLIASAVMRRLDLSAVAVSESDWCLALMSGL